MNIKLSASKINKTAPYKVSFQSNTSFEFQTDDGSIFQIGFTEDFMISEIGLYQFYIQNKTKTPSFKDVKLKETIIAVFEHFFEDKNRVAVYICDSMDGKQHIRNRLFRMWFNSYSQKQHYTLKTASIEFEGISYYSALLMHNNNDDYKMYLQLYKQFIEQLSEKYQ